MSIIEKKGKSIADEADDNELYHGQDGERLPRGTVFTRKRLESCKFALEKLSRMSVFGFNSSKFDMKLLIGYICIYAFRRKMKMPDLVTRGTSYFSVTIDNLIFKGNVFVRVCSL